jgi:hypothetical protein
LSVAVVTQLDTPRVSHTERGLNFLEATQCLVQVAVAGPTVDAAIVVQAAHVPVIVIDRLHETQAVEPENDLWVWHLVGLAGANPLHWPIGIQGDSLSVPRYIADLLKSPSPGKSRVGHLRMISLARRRSSLEERGGGAGQLTWGFDA